MDLGKKGREGRRKSPQAFEREEKKRLTRHSNGQPGHEEEGEREEGMEANLRRTAKVKRGNKEKERLLSPFFPRPSREKGGEGVTRFSARPSKEKRKDMAGLSFYLFEGREKKNPSPPRKRESGIIGRRARGKKRGAKPMGRKRGEGPKRGDNHLYALQQTAPHTQKEKEEREKKKRNHLVRRRQKSQKKERENERAEPSFCCAAHRQQKGGGKERKRRGKKSLHDP